MLGRLDSHMQKNGTGPLFYISVPLIYLYILHTKIQSKWIKELNVQLETIKLEECTGVSSLMQVLMVIFLFDAESKGNKRKTSGTTSN